MFMICVKLDDVLVCLGFAGSHGAVHRDRPSSFKSPYLSSVLDVEMLGDVRCNKRCTMAL